MENLEGVRHTNYLVARRYAEKQFGAAQKALNGVDIPQIDDRISLSSSMTNYIFKLQSEIESGGRMDYHRYAQKMWLELVEEPNAPDAREVLSLFENSMIVGLHEIPMEEMVYPHVLDSLEALTDIKGDEVKEVILWSTGDVAATGYQSAKIERSGIVKKFFNALQHNGENLREFKRKTRYMVDDDKVKRLADYVEKLTADARENPKIVIIEDSKSNFGKVKKALVDRLGLEIAGSINVIPVWAAYSREGKSALEEAEKSPEKWEKYMETRRDLNAIDSFAELLDPRFNEILKDSYVFVDFDGVIGDNIAMRKAQAAVIYRS